MTPAFHAGSTGSNPVGGAYSSAVVRTAMQWSTMVPWCRLECTPACQDGARGFKSRRDRHTRSPHKIANDKGRGRVAQLAERPPEMRQVRAEESREGEGGVRKWT